MRSGVDAWQAGNHEEAIRLWRPLADRGDADAQYNIAQAYFLGRGVPQNMNLAEQWYERAARQGHEEAQGALGLILFQNGRRREAMPWIEQAADRGDPRAQYVLGTALFNGDLVEQDCARAYALMSRAADERAAAGGHPARRDGAAYQRRGPRARRRDRRAPLPPRRAPVADRRRAPAAAGRRRAPPRGRARRRCRPSRRRTPPRSRRRRSRAPARPAPGPAGAAPGARWPAAGGRWRIQLGAFSNEANARRAWGAVAGRLPGLSPITSAPAR